MWLDRMWLGGCRSNGLDRMVVSGPRGNLRATIIVLGVTIAACASAVVALRLMRPRREPQRQLVAAVIVIVVVGLSAFRRVLDRHLLGGKDEGIRTGMAGGRRSSSGHDRRNWTVMHHVGDWLHQHSGYRNRLRALRCRSWSAQWTTGQLHPPRRIVGNGVAHAPNFRRPNALG